MDLDTSAASPIMEPDTPEPQNYASPKYGTSAYNEPDLPTLSSDTPTPQGNHMTLPVLSSDDFDPLSQNDATIVNNNNKRANNPFTDLHRPNKAFKARNVSNVPDSDTLIAEARKLLVKAADCEKNYGKQTKILDLIQIFRDTLEKGLDITATSSKILANQVTHLEKMNQKLDSNLKKVAFVTNNVSNQQTVPKQQENATYANIAAQNAKNAQNGPNVQSLHKNAQNAQNAQNWNTVEPKKKNPTPSKPKDDFRNYRVVVTANEPLGVFSPLNIRNQINQAFAAKGIKDPVIATVTKSQGDNLVITTTKQFNADYLLEHAQIWKPLFPTIKEIQKDQLWYKVVCHGIPIADFNNNLELIKTEITTFNKGYTPIGMPFWLTSEEKRRTALAGSVVVAFGTEQEAKRAVSNHLYIAGISVKVQKYFNTSPLSQCGNCCGFGHPSNRCKNNPFCSICAEPHATAVHKCNTCSTVKKPCAHSIIKCVNCHENHRATSEACEFYLAIKNKEHNMTNNSSTNL